MNVEWIRANIRVSLGNIYYTGNGQLGLLADRINVETRRFNRNPPRFVECGGRLVRRRAVPVNIKQTPPDRSPVPLINQIDYCTIPWRRAINLLSTPHRAWIRYCYGGYRYRDEQFTVLREVWDRFLKQQRRKIPDRILKRLQALALLAVQEVAREINGEPDYYSSAEIAALLGVKKQNWSEVYRDKWSQLNKITQSIDLEGLYGVYSIRFKLPEKKDLKRLYFSPII